MADKPDLWRLPAAGDEVFGAMRHAGGGIWVPGAGPGERTSTPDNHVRGRVIGAVIMIASPLAWSRGFQAGGNFPEGVGMALAQYLDLFDRGPVTSAMLAVERPARELRVLYEASAPSEHLATDIVSAARRLLSAAGIPAPPEGWDLFSGERVDPVTAQAAERFAHAE